MIDCWIASYMDTNSDKWLENGLLSRLRELDFTSQLSNASTWWFEHFRTAISSVFYIFSYWQSFCLLWRYFVPFPRCSTHFSPFRSRILTTLSCAYIYLTTVNRERRRVDVTLVEFSCRIWTKGNTSSTYSNINLPNKSRLALTRV